MHLRFCQSTFVVGLVSPKLGVSLGYLWLVELAPFAGGEVTSADVTRLQRFYFAESFEMLACLWLFYIVLMFERKTGHHETILRSTKF